MARGIISVKAGTGSGSTGKIMVTDGKKVKPSDASAGFGTLINFTEDIGSCEVGNIVDFEAIDGAAGKMATSIKACSTIKNISLPTPPPSDLTVITGESLYIAGTGVAITTNFTVNGGTLIILTDPSVYKPNTYTTVLSGTITSPASTGDNSAIILDNGVSIQADVTFESACKAMIKNSEVSSQAKVLVTEATLTLRNTNVNGTLVSR